MGPFFVVGETPLFLSNNLDGKTLQSVQHQGQFHVAIFFLVPNFN
jgi:hypothetical protein